MLEGGDRAVGLRKGDMQMSEDVCRGPVRGNGGWLRWRAARGQCCAEFGLGQVESLPNALPGAVAEMAVGGTNGSGQGADGGELEEAPKAAGGEAESSDFVGAPDAEGATAAGAGLAIAAKDASGAEGFLAGVLVVKTEQTAMAIEGADDLAMRTGCLLEPLGKRRPFAFVPAKPSVVGHESAHPRKSNSTPRRKKRGRGGVRWISWSGVARCEVLNRGRVRLPNSWCNQHAATG